MTRALLLVCAIVFVAGSSFAAETSSGYENSDPKSETVEAENAERVDGTTPPPAGLTLSPQNRSLKGLRATKTPHGVSKVDLDGRFHHTLVLKIAPDGSRSVECIDSHEIEVELLRIDRHPADDGSKED